MTAESQVRVESDAGALALAAAGILREAARDAAQERERFVLALSGGSTPRALHRLASQEPFLSTVPWKQTHIFWVDERCVPPEDPASNYGAARKDLLDAVPIPQGQVHPMPWQAPARQAAHRYAGEMQGFFRLKQGAFPCFDLIFLGVGEDGHTASLFPGQASVEETERWVVAVKGGNPDLRRLTLTIPVLNRARRVVFLVSGAQKAPVVKTLLTGPEAPLPARRVRPVGGTLTWLLDRDAASLLPGDTAHENRSCP